MSTRDCCDIRIMLITLQCFLLCISAAARANVQLPELKRFTYHWAAHVNSLGQAATWVTGAVHQGDRQARCSALSPEITEVLWLSFPGAPLEYFTQRYFFFQHPCGRTPCANRSHCAETGTRAGAVARCPYASGS